MACAWWYLFAAVDGYGYNGEVDGSYYKNNIEQNTNYTKNKRKTLLKSRTIEISNRSMGDRIYYMVKEKDPCHPLLSLTSHNIWRILSSLIISLGILHLCCSICDQEDGGGGGGASRGWKITRMDTDTVNMTKGSNCGGDIERGGVIQPPLFPYVNTYD